MNLRIYSFIFRSSLALKVLNITTLARNFEGFVTSGQFMTFLCTKGKEIMNPEVLVVVLILKKRERM